ncbi:hypothetical protein H310_05856 [Aphanomyces invadans]|uniref:Uncharacterized protein n=1 Tax=Aphanomyces invadans TaxID=157072 RepID=A0A024U7R3_9STRA|nr:hypothetical protein H310_05856 [Aphanomyces invadans]ETW02309.1 hypothetical protein H310_05856 [Aphanomyces invadans]|eukprot:XP_008868914.1 hypothetical protein H310_05856 [Aphanomyces invadans]
MARRKSSVHGGGARRTSSVLRKSSSELPTASVSQLIETNDMHRTMSTTNLSHTESQAEELLQAVSILESETSEAAQKRQVLKLFEWFKAQYAQLSGALRSSCRELRAELLLNVTKLQTQLQVHEVAAQNLAFFKEAVHVSREREQEALKIIEELREKVVSLEGQVKDLQRHPPPPEKNPPKAVASRAASASTRYIEEDLSTFHEWKILNKVWSPSKSNARKADDLYWNNTPSTLGDRSSVGFPVTPMERAMTTVPQSRKKQASASSRSSQRLPTV